MSYFDGFLAAVPKANKQAFIDHAKAADSLFIEHGAKRVVECWSDDVPHGKTNDFYTAVLAKDDEAVIFSFIEWPDKDVRDAAMAAIKADMESDNPDKRMSHEHNPMPFDGARLIYGGFAPVLDMSA